MKKKTLISIIAVALVLCVSVGGVLAWLTAKADPITNTFTVGNIGLTLNETTTNYKMVPGNEISKDPKVTVAAGSEACYLFVKFDKSANLDTFISYAKADGWTKLDGVTEEVYYRVVNADTAKAGVTYSVLAGDKVSVKNSVTKADMDGLSADGAVQPTLTFTAYAVQKDNIADVTTAWNQVKNN